ncbi:hypothetical protein GINT2_000382 [Glugoides intestinalis]
MDNNGNDKECLRLLNQIKTNGMNDDLYNRIAYGFNSVQHASTENLLELLKHFINFHGVALYVNEIKNCLKEKDPELFKAYGNRFKRSKGCYEVFGIISEDLQVYDFKIKVDASKEEEKKKVFDLPKERKNNDRNIKREARRQAIQKHKQVLEKRLDKKERKEELDKLMRKQDL